MTKLAPRGLSVAATSLALSIACVAALAPPAIAAADEGGEGAPAGPLAFAPAAPSFPKVTAGAVSSPPETIDVYNAGADPVAVDAVVLEGADPGDFQITGHGCGPLGPGQHCSVWVAFTPGSAGTKQATLSVKLKEAPEQTVELSGVAVPVQLAFAPTAYDFGVQPVHNGPSASFQLTNAGEAAAQLGSVGTSGPDRDNFWVDGGICGGGYWLQPGESCFVQVRFNPWDMVEYEAQLEAHAQGATFLADLAGTGGRAVLEPASNPVDLGTATVGASGAIEEIVLTNTGNIEGGFFIAVIAGGDAGSFRLLDEDCTGVPLAPGETCTARVRFTPQDAGPKLARLALFGDGDGGAMVLLSGEGVAPAVSLAPTSFDFGALAVGTRSGAHAFVVRNDGGAPLSLDRVSIVGPDLDQFALAGDECTGATLAPGEECLVRARFAPDSAGAKAATLRIGSDAGAFTAVLAGASSGPDADEGDLRAAAAGGSAEPRPWRQRGRHRRFARGDDLPGAKRLRPHRVKVRASAVSR